METKQKRSRRPAQAAQTGKRRTAPASQQRKASDDVVFMPAKPFNRSRLILQLATVVAVVLALMLGISVFFKVDTDKIVVSGTNKYTAWDVANSAGLKDGENLLMFSRARVAGRIKKDLKYVRDVRIGIKLPDTVYIDIVEVEVTYAAAARDGSWWLLSSEGRVIKRVEAETADQNTKILGVQLEEPKAGEMAKAYQQPQTATDASGVPIPVTVTAAQRLRTAVEITAALENNGIIGSVASIDVNDMGDIQMWYGTQYQIELGDGQNLNTKIANLKAALDQYLEEHDSGVLDASDGKQVIYDPF